MSVQFSSVQFSLSVSLCTRLKCFRLIDCPIDCVGNVTCGGVECLLSYDEYCQVDAASRTFQCRCS